MANATLMAVDGAPKLLVGVAVQLWNPVTQRGVSADLTVTLQGRNAKPIVNRSGYFVWMGQESDWPPAITVDPGTAPFEPIANLNLLPQRPAQWPNVPPSDRLIRVPLTPTAQYPYAGEVVVLRGDLHQKDASTPPNYLPLTDAEVWLEWWDVGLGNWRAADPTMHVWTRVQGHFAAPLRIPRGGGLEPDTTNGFLKIRVAVVRGGVRKSTPNAFQFLPPPAAAGRIPEEDTPTLWASLDWGTLV